MDTVGQYCPFCGARVKFLQAWQAHECPECAQVYVIHIVEVDTDLKSLPRNNRWTQFRRWIRDLFA